MSEKKERGGPPGSGATVHVVRLRPKAAAEVRRRAMIAGERYRKEEANETASDIIEFLADVRLLLITDDMLSALPWLQETRGMCVDEIAQRGLDQLIAALWTAKNIVSAIEESHAQAQP